MSGHIADPVPELGPLFELEERQGPKLEKATFEGPTEEDEPARCQRLGGQLADVYEAISDGAEYTLDELSRTTGHPAASVSAQLRHLRKQRFGGFVIVKRHDGAGLYRYRLELRPDGRPTRAGEQRYMDRTR